MKRKKLLHKKHTGKLVHRHNTSYGLLMLILFLALMPLLTITRSVSAAGEPVTASSGVYAVVVAPVPESAPVIKSLSSGKTYTTAELVPVSGSCPKDSIVKVFKNQVLAGSALCVNGTFNVNIDLFIGSNTILARPYNVNNMPGPDSVPVNVTLSLGDVASDGFQGSPNAPANQLFITSDDYFKGIQTKETLKWPITISGGQAPYAVSVGWGDGKTDLISRGQAGSFEIQHVYDKQGTGYKGSYTITLQATDQEGTKAFLQLVLIVSGESANNALSVAHKGFNASGLVGLAWKLLLGCLLAIALFWLGEQYELKVLKKKYKIA